MKIATIINPKESKQTNIILKNTIYEKNSNLVHNANFKLNKEFFDFVEDLIGKNKIGSINDCFVSITDYEKLNEYIDPINKLLGVLHRVNEENNK